MPIARRIVCVVFAFAMSCGCGAPHIPGPPNSADTAKSDADKPSDYEDDYRDD